jgi:CD2 antigen cytoplasmic tail-binding protein 2
MMKAKEAQMKREERMRKQAAEEDAVLTTDLLTTLISELETGETPMEAMKRWGPGKVAKKVPLWKQKKLNKNKMDVDQPEAEANGNANVTEAEDPKEVERKRAVEAITGAADALYSRGQRKIWDTERELLMRQYKRETGEDWKTPASAVPASDDMQWEFRWTVDEEGTVHGPYDSAMMKAWQEGNYFEQGAEFRKVGDEDWSEVLNVD